MKSSIILFSCFLSITIYSIAQDQPVDSWLSSGAFEVHKPAYIQGQNIKKEDFQDKFMLGASYFKLVDLRPVDGAPISWLDNKSSKWKMRNSGSEGIIDIKPIKNAECLVLK